MRASLSNLQGRELGKTTKAYGSHSISCAESLDGGPDLHDLTAHLVPHDATVLDRPPQSLLEHPQSICVQIGPADSTGLHPQQDFIRRDLGSAHLLAPNVTATVTDDCFHVVFLQTGPAHGLESEWQTTGTEYDTSGFLEIRSDFQGGLLTSLFTPCWTPSP